MPQQEETIFNLNVTPDTIDEEVKKALDLHRLLRQPDFEYWFEEWEKGFPEATLERGVGNFQLGGETPWRGQTDQRPRYREWTSKEQRLKLGYRQIEYWKNKALEGESVFLQGTDAELIQHIIQLEYEGGGSTGEDALSAKNSVVPLEGQPLIKLFFLEVPSVSSTADTRDRQPARAKKFIRLMDVTDDPRVATATGLDLIDKTFVRQICDRIVTEFGMGGGYVWEKGKLCCNYRGKIARRQGLEGYAFVKNRSDGIMLFTKLLTLVGKQPDPQGFIFSENNNPGEAFPENPADFTLLGEQWHGKRQRPILDVRFKSAQLYLPSIPTPFGLVKGEKVVFDPSSLTGFN